MDQITPGITYGPTALTVAIYSIPLLFVIWRLTKTRRTASRRLELIVLKYLFTAIALSLIGIGVVKISPKIHAEQAKAYVCDGYVIQRCKYVEGAEAVLWSIFKHGN